MRELTILHLSDLHLRFDDRVEYDAFVEKLVKCISEYQKQIHVIVITGDLIDKGKIVDFGNCYKLFICKISEAARCPEENIFCVAGNHDAERDDDIAKFRDELKADPTKGLCFEIKKQKFDKLMCRFVYFEQFYKKMHPNNTDIKSYGVDIVNIDNMKIAIVRVNSSIYTFDKYDYMQLGLSKIQLDELTKQYKNKKRNIIKLI